MTAQLDWSIYQLKQHLYLHSNKSADDLRIIFAGGELANNVLLRNCQLSVGTVVHAINVVSADQRPGDTFIPSTDVIAPTPSGIRVSDPSRRRARFYIYCKTQCDAVKPGKLRVRCGTCKDEAFELNSGPNSWEDVLNPNTIQGRCNSGSNCAGEFAEFYFRCNDHDNVNLEERPSTIPLQLFRTNLRDVPCLACTDVCDVVLVFPCTDNHVICALCFAEYCRTKLDSRHFVLQRSIGYTLPCPGLGPTCDSTFLNETHHFMALGRQQYERYKNFATEEFVLQNGGILCPAENCGNGLLLDDDSVRKVTCRRSAGGCGFQFCRLCRLAYHDSPCNDADTSLTAAVMSSIYEVSEQNSMLARWQDDENSRSTITRTTRPCPGCHVATEKSGGCNHMSCARCRLEWCWLCLVAWGRNCESDHWFRAA